MDAQLKEQLDRIETDCLVTIGRQSQQLQRIEEKLNEVLAFRDQLQALLAGFTNGGGLKLMSMFRGKD